VHTGVDILPRSRAAGCVYGLFASALCMFVSSGDNRQHGRSWVFGEGDR
jgi:hypothetical protein